MRINLPPKFNFSSKFKTFPRSSFSEKDLNDLSWYYHMVNVNSTQILLIKKGGFVYE